MKIYFSSAKDYEKKYYEDFILSKSIDMNFQPTNLNQGNCLLASGSEFIFAFVNDDLNAGVLEKLKETGLRAIFLRCAGYNNVDLDAAKDLGISVARVPSYSPHAIAEFTIAMALNLNRKLHKSYQRTKDFDFRLDHLVGSNLFEKRVGVLGTGEIGSLVAKLFHAFGATVVAFDKHKNQELQKLGIKYLDKSEIISQSDIISFHLPLNESTSYFLNRENIFHLKKGVKIINTGRGALIESKALINALKAKHLGGVALDVYEEEADMFFEDHSSEGIEDEVLARLLSFPNVLVSSHQAYLTEESLQAIAETCIENLRCFLIGEKNRNFIQ